MIRNYIHEKTMSKEEYLEQYKALDIKFNEYKNKMIRLQHEYAREHADYQVGERVIASLKDSEFYEVFECERVGVTRTGEFTYEFKTISRESDESYYLSDLTDIQKKSS